MKTTAPGHRRCAMSGSAERSRKESRRPSSPFMGVLSVTAGPCRKLGESQDIEPCGLGA
jgi:hypothetical protein